MNRDKAYGIKITLILLNFVLLDCSVHPRAENSQLASTEKDPLTASEHQEKIVPEYRLGFGDVVEIKFFRNIQFNEEITVRPDGRISLAKIGELMVSGMTCAQLDRVITETYGEFVREPDVTVIVREFGGYRVYVLGEVESPGGYNIQRNMTILQALAEAGGTKISAKLGSVILLRRGQGEEVTALKVDIGKSIRAKNRLDVSRNDIYVQPQDIVFVPKTFIASASDFLTQVYDGVLPPLDMYIKAAFYYGR